MDSLTTTRKAANVRPVARAPAAPPPQVTRTPNGESCWLVLHVGESAEVTINGRRTRTPGEQRVYVAHLQPDSPGRFHIALVDGAKVVERDITLMAGETKTLYLEGNKLASR